jgi:hypothetical protein
VSIDQMESPVPGLVAHMKGSPTRERYNCATIFVDHYSDVLFVHLQKVLTGDETLEAKKAFEIWARSHDISISHYHADNGRFIYGHMPNQKFQIAPSIRNVWVKRQGE